MLDDLKICDPAIGSGAFPIGLLQEIYWTKLAINSGLNRAEAKRRIIQRSIHGVDLDAGAVEIARLRFWLALVVDEEAPRPLPNLDYQIMQGNSLLESFEGIPLNDLSSLLESRSFVMTLLGSNQSEFMLPVEQREFVEPPPVEGRSFETLRREYFLCHDPAEKARLRHRMDSAVIRAVEGQFADARLKLQRKLDHEAENDARKRQQARGYTVPALEQRKRAGWQIEIETLAGKSARLHDLLADPRKERPFFLWHLWFQEVLPGVVLI